MPDYMELNRTALFHAEGADPMTDFAMVGKIVAVYDGTGGKSYGVEVEGVEHRVPAHEATIYLGDVGDWIVTTDGSRGTITRTNPVHNVEGRDGTYYDLLMQGGHERHVYHLGTDDHLTIPYFGGRAAAIEPLFIVKD